MIKLEQFIKNKAIREWVVAIFFVLIVVVIFRTWLYASYRVPTGSMIHTIEIGDYLLVNSHAYGFVVPFTKYKLFTSKVSRNDVVVFPYPENPEIDFIKRVIAVGGDEIQIIGETVFINGKQEEGEYIYYDDSRLTPPERIRTFVPEGKLWVMGDNRRNSKDSRYWGFVDESTVKGKGAVIFWSHDPNKSIFGGYRFERIFRKLQ